MHTEASQNSSNVTGDGGMFAVAHWTRIVWGLKSTDDDDILPEEKVKIGV